MTDVVVDTLRLRGPSARRLARVAATALPRALERALADVGDVSLDRIAVVLDVTDHDDETLAVLWADAIRASVLDAAPRSRPGRGHQAAGPGIPGPHAATRPDPVAAARAWFPGAGPGQRRVPSALLALGDPGLAASTRARMGAGEWAELVEHLARALGLPSSPPPAGEDGSSGPAPSRSGRPGPGAPGAARDLATPAPGSARLAGTAAGDSTAEPGPDAETGAPVLEREVLDRLAALAELAEEDGGDLPLDGLTRAAGLVLLYPWLGDHCRRAEDLHPGLDPLDVREAALAAVVDPEDPAAADDPLVRLLAGRPDPPDRRTRVPLPALPEVAVSAGTVLASFAALLPGFERSSESFVRHSWIARHGVLDTDREPVLLTAATHPLDVLLPLLPYPVGLLKLPWSPPITVRFR